MSRVSILVCASLLLCLVLSIALPSVAGTNVFVNGRALTKTRSTGWPSRKCGYPGEPL